MNEQNPDQVINDVMRMEERNRQALSLLLELQREKDGHLFALSTRMGETSSYVTTRELGMGCAKCPFCRGVADIQGKS